MNFLDYFPSTKVFNNTKNAHLHHRNINISGQSQICKNEHRAWNTFKKSDEIYSKALNASSTWENEQR